MKVLTVFGTRPEAIKMCPVVHALAQSPQSFQSVVCVTAQHREMLDQVLTLFQIQPDHDLDLMKPNQDLFQITSKVLLGMKTVLDQEKPDIVLVHGDTTTSMAASLAAFYARIPVGHVEAGLRTWDKDYPFPEEMNRVITDSIADLYFAPTEGSRQNLLKSGAKPENIYVTGNTVIDALLYTVQKTQSETGTEAGKKMLCDFPLLDADKGNLKLDPDKRLILVTVHRRENFGEPLQEICSALKTLVENFPDVEMVIPVHPNPNVRPVVEAALGNMPRVHLISPMEYEPFCRIMARAHLILTDSGGIQEEAPSLSKPVLVLRDETERPEAVDMGVVKLVGPHADRIIFEASRLLSDDVAYQAMARAANPYGDGKASERIIEALKAFQVNQIGEVYNSEGISSKPFVPSGVPA